MAEDILDTNSDSPIQISKPNPAGDEVPNGHTNHQHYAADPEAQEMVIESLRNQIQDLFSQVTQLNAKLVKSYDRVSDLEDDLHVSSAQLRSSSIKVSQLELERTQHLAALNTGLLVEKHHVTTELNRLMEKATEEAAQRGQAESARVAIEKELDDLSASLFNQANTMVAEARYGQHVSQRKAEEAEQALKGAEEAVGVMQQQVQALQEEKEAAERKAAEIGSLMGKGKWIDKRDDGAPAPTLRLFSSHLPYQEFLIFVAHLRQLHTSSQNAPAMSTLLPLPFLTRLLTEDSEPTIRLDFAPSLSWLSRRSVLAAIHAGQLTIEPMSSTNLLTESSHLANAGISGLANNENIPCALCGTPVFPQAPSTNTSPTRPPTHPLIGMAHSYSGSASWSTNLFKKNPSSFTTTSTTAPPPLPARSQTRTTQTSSTPIYPSQVYIFRISSTQTSTLPHLPLLKPSTSITPSPSGSTTPSSSHQHTLSLSHSALSGTASQSSSTIYPLCTSGWCLARLRTTCSMWAFVRTSIVEKIWEEELPIVILPPAPGRAASSTPSLPEPASSSGNTSGSADKPPVPPRKRGLWGLASAIGERAASWSESVSDKDKARKASPSASTAPAEKDKKDLKTLPPPPPYQEHSGASTSDLTTPSAAPLASAAPPPLPRRSEGRARTPVNQPSPSPSPIPTEPTATLTASFTTSPPPILPTAENQLPEQTPSPAASGTAEVKPSAPIPEDPVKEGVPPAESSPGSSVPVPATTAAAAVPTPPQTPTRPQHPASTASPAPPLPPRAVKRLSASFARPGTPSNIPLPESRPGTPPVGVSGAPNPPSRTNSPALGGSPSTPPNAPPPIPRRAAGRVPRKPQGGEGGDSSRPESPAVTPATAAAVPVSPGKSGNVQAQIQALGAAASMSQLQLDSVAEESKDETKTSESPEASKLVEASSESNGPATTAAPASSEAVAPADAEDEEQKEKEKDEKEGTEVEADKEVTRTMEAPKEETKEEETKEASEQEKKDKSAAVSLNEDDLPPAYAPPPLPPRRPEPVKEKKEKDGVKSTDVDGSEAGEDEGERVYVGDATWEERTWKELTKLREEMYWARIGAVRS
ncbi:hypothetical protein P691DRAFT_758015 [Macrolepiota fuliginosa MF-IS2]|uniref:GDP/GTP exchange factor Sec2 N-terminal domain-containing protein n=1 Tax=Macrolepiota fuliginosa MF-IS2 TaxID=1400762 RepID=A0A9P5XGL8_9AGAR|nr:hypothetical protein P691DRAFT_758015 [Macrolepiota fuliginosa MF-IS2]